MFVFYFFQVRFSWRSSWLPTRSVPFSVNSLSACTFGAFIPGVTAAQGHSQRLIPLFHPIPSNCRNVRCTWACTGVKNKWGRRAFSFSSSFFFFLYDSCSFSNFACCWSTLHPHFCLYNDPENLLLPKKSFSHVSTVPWLQKLWGNKDLII